MPILRLSVPEAFVLMSERPDEFSRLLEHLSKTAIGDLIEEATELMALPDNSGPFSYTKPAAGLLYRHCTREIEARQRLELLRTEPARLSVVELLDALSWLGQVEGAREHRTTGSVQLLGSCAALDELCRSELRRRHIHPFPDTPG